MTISGTTSRNTYLGSGSAGPFAYGFRIFAGTDLLVTKRDAAGLETTLSYPGDFSVSGVGNRSGGSITLGTALANGETLSIRRVRPLTQETDLRNGGAFFPETYEDALDSLTMVDQQLQDQLDRSVFLSESYDPADYDLQLPAPSAGKALVWNVAGTGLDNATLSAAQLSAWNATNNHKLDVFTSAHGDFTAGVTTALALASAPGNTANVIVTRRTAGANLLYESDEYSVSGTTLTFTSPIAAGTTRIEVRYFLTYQINTADSGNVTWSAAGAGAIGRDVKAKLQDVVYLSDYCVGDGSDETTQFQKAIDATPDGGILLGGPGKTYGIGAAGFHFTNRTNVLFDGNKATLKMLAVATQIGASGMGSTFGYLDTCDGVIVRNCVVNGNSKASNPFSLNNCTECEISTNRMTASGYLAGIFSVGGVRNRFLFNTVATGLATSRGLWIGNWGVGLPEDGSVIIGNVVRSMLQTAITYSGVHGRVQGNFCTGGGGTGIVFGGALGNSTKRTVIVGNVIADYDNSNHGIQCDVLYSSDDDLPVDVAIVGNICSSIGPSGGSGIYAINLTHSLIADNICTDAGADGITIGARSKHLAIIGNRCRDSRAGGARTQKNGILLEAGTYDVNNFLIHGNVCRNNTQKGIAIRNIAAELIDRVELIANFCCDNGQSGIQVSDSSGATATTGTAVTGISCFSNVCAGNTTVDLRIDVLDLVLYGNRYATEQNIASFSFVNADATPSVKGGRPCFTVGNTGATNVTAFDDGANGQEILLFFTNANSTLVNSAGLVLTGSVNVTPTANSMIRLRQIGGNWIELGRSIK